MFPKCLGEAVTLYRADSGDVLCFHGEDKLGLAEVRASIADGTVRKFAGKKGKPEHIVWRLRLLAEAGLLELPKVDHRPLPPDAPKAARSVYAGYLERLAINWVSFPGQPIMFTWRFSAVWYSLSQRKAQEGMRYLLKEGFILEVGSEHVRGKATALFQVYLEGWKGYSLGIEQLEKDFIEYELALEEALATGTIEQLIGEGE